MGLKRVVQAGALIVVFPVALLTGFGRIGRAFEFFAHILALGPGLPGSYLRVAYYVMTLRSCSPDCHIGFGSFFAHSDASVGARVYIGMLCVLGQSNIGDRVQIASGVQILSGDRQHGRAQDGSIQGAEEGVFEVISIGSDCWIGAGAIVMAEIGEGSTVGAGSLVTRPIPPRSVAVGNPARVVKSTTEP